MALHQDEPDRARALVEEGLAVGLAMEDAAIITQNLIALGHAARDWGDHRRAMSYCKESLAMSRELGQNLDTVEILQGMARL